MSSVGAAPRAAMVASHLPPLLLTPPRNMMLPLLPMPCLILLPTPCLIILLPTPCLIILPPPSMPKPGRADSVERWDVRMRPAGSATPSSTNPSGGIPGSELKRPGSPASSSATSSDGTIPGRADSCERWDINKIKNQSSLSPQSCAQRWASNKRPPSRASSAAERWDIHKKPRQHEDDPGRGQSNTTNKTATAIAR
ncbi:hypothetical protein ABZP36_009146 [Zizania latifolia]